MLEDHAGLGNALALGGLQEALDMTTGYLDRVLRDPVTGLYAGSQDADEHYYALDAGGGGQGPPPAFDRRHFTSWESAVAVRHTADATRCWRTAPRDHATALLVRLFRQPRSPR